LTLDPGATLLFIFRYWEILSRRTGLFNLLRGRFESLEDIELRDRREKTEQREKDKKEKLRAERLKRMQAFQVQLFLVEDQTIFCLLSGEKYRNHLWSPFCGPSTGSRIRIRLCEFRFVCFI
jgi:hypothetical protein